MTYAEAVARLLALRGGEHAGMRPGLERIEGLLGALGNPERRYTLVQVGGTNGKGSTAAMLAAMLRAQGRRVGLYTSPHLLTLRERIRVDGEAISEDALADGYDALATLIARADASMFEAITALALDWFEGEGVEVAVLEVGLGGRLDSTTVGVPAAAIVTRIDLDHQAWLGDTLGEIAAEKAAIVRPGVGAAVSSAQAPAAQAVLVQRACAVGVPLAMEGRELFVEVSERSLGGQRLRCHGPGWEMNDLLLGLLGTYQPSNALLAVAAARALGVPPSAIADGLLRARWPGRFEVRRAHGGWLVLDGAHNPGGALALAHSLTAYFAGQPLTLVVGVSADKDAAGILRALAPLAERVILTAASNPRAAAPADLAAAMPPTAAAVQTAASVEEALTLAGAPPRTPVVCVAGSLFLVGDALRTLGAGDQPCAVEKAGHGLDSVL
jgi:dihydrofolate synthase / folylpolyglutamate synthase